MDLSCHFLLHPLASSFHLLLDFVPRHSGKLGGGSNAEGEVAEDEAARTAAVESSPGVVAAIGAGPARAVPPGCGARRRRAGAGAQVAGAAAALPQFPCVTAPVAWQRRRVRPAPRSRAPPAAAAPAPAQAAPPGGRARCCGGRPRGGEDAAWRGGSAPAELPEEAAGRGGAEGAPGARPSPAARPPGAVSGGGAGMLARAGKFLPRGGSPASRPDFSPALLGK